MIIVKLKSSVRSLNIFIKQKHMNNQLFHLEYSCKPVEKLTNLDTTVFPRSSPLSTTSLSAEGRTFQNSVTNSFPLRLLFCRMSFARYKRGTFRAISELRNCLSHVATTSSALLRWNIHQCDKAISEVKVDTYLQT